MDDVRSRTTLEDVARVAGVSRATASRAVRGGELVSPVALEAVRRAVEHTHAVRLVMNGLIDKVREATGDIVPDAIA